MHGGATSTQAIILLRRGIRNGTRCWNYFMFIVQASRCGMTCHINAVYYKVKLRVFTEQGLESDQHFVRNGLTLCRARNVILVIID